MNSAKIENLILSRIKEWQHFDDKRIVRANRKCVVPETGVWSRVTIKGGINSIASLSDKPCIKEVGTVIVQLFERIGSGTGEIKKQADSLANHLGCYTVDKLELLAPSIIDVGDDGNGFYQINVSIPYRYY